VDTEVVRLEEVSASPSSQDRLAAALEFERQTLAMVVEEVKPIEGGWVVRSAELPDVWVFNNVQIEADVSYDEAVGLCRRHVPGSSFDHILILDDRVGSHLSDTFRREGWDVDVDVHSVLAKEPDRVADTDGVVEAGEEEALELMGQWLKSDPTLHLTQVELAQLREGNRRSWAARDARRLGIRDEQGRLAGMTLLFSDGQVAQVEDVYVAPEARGRGYARALVSEAIRLAREGGHELTFIVADDEDWPKQLYWKLGFEPVGADVDVPPPAAGVGVRA
jgi:ribosomal protein S18 acetylase RimI-like enzyme